MVVTLSPECVNSAIADFRGLNVLIVQLNMSRLASLLVGGSKLKRLIESLDGDVVHCHGFRANHLVASSELSIPVVSTIHSDLCRDYELTYGGFGKLMARREYAALHGVDVVIAVSPSVAERAAEFGLRSEVIFNGVDLSVCRAVMTQEESERERARLGWPSQRLVILHTGALVGLKQPLGVIAAFQRSDLPRKAILVFAGSGPLLKQCKRAASDCPTITFLGHRSDLPRLLRAADAVVSNSVSEGLPMALLEACACGLRILASDIEPHRCVAELFPEQVDLFPHEKVGVLTDRMNALGRYGSKRRVKPPACSLEAVSAERMSCQYQDVYDKVLARTQALTVR